MGKKKLARGNKKKEMEIDGWAKQNRQEKMGKREWVRRIGQEGTSKKNCE